MGSLLTRAQTYPTFLPEKQQFLCTNIVKFYVPDALFLRAGNKIIVT